MFIILSQPRSGTHLLAHLLNSHPDLKCYDEVFIEKPHPEKAVWPKEYLLDKKKFSTIGDNEGCIVMYYDVWATIKKEDHRTLDKIKKSKIIHLVRNNMDNHSLSYLRAGGDGTGLKKMKYYRARALGQKYRSMFTVIYEEMTSDKQIIEYENPDLLNFLGVKPMKLTTNLPKKSLEYARNTR